MIYIRKLYDWVLSWADKPTGPTALGGISIAEASFFPIPPDILLIPLALGKREKALYFAMICSVCSIIGAILGYGIGKWAWWAEPDVFSSFAGLFFEFIPGFSNDSFEQIRELYDEYNFLIIFTAGFTPIPFKLFTISAGAFKINFIMFLIASAVSRSARFFIVAWLIRRFGEPIRIFIDKYFNLLAIIFTVLLIGGFALLKLFF
tara:strand:+ start:278 stop:892 length:615 start_codon:yes stop_codon:yes gene_type:complete